MFEKVSCYIYRWVGWKGGAWLMWMKMTAWMMRWIVIEEEEEEEERMMIHWIQILDTTNSWITNLVERMAALKQGAKELLSSTTTANIQLKGMKLRQEFCCPITYDLMRDPVVLADGEHYAVISFFCCFPVVISLLSVLPFKTWQVTLMKGPLSSGGYVVILAKMASLYHLWMDIGSNRPFSPTWLWRSWYKT